MTQVFLDTVGLLAIWDTSDQWHPNAKPVFEQMMLRRIPIVTSTFVLAECANAAARRPYRHAVAQFRDLMESSNRILIPSPQEWNNAWRDYAAGTVGQASLVDHLSFILMRRLNITDVFSNDRHFKTAGFRTLF